jgi:hypothetical protein
MKYLHQWKNILMSKIFICGDSFAVPDPEYGKCWVDLIGNVTNLAQVCATNLLISQQVDIAIREKAKFIICLFTSSSRQLVKFENAVKPISWYSIDATEFDSRQKKLLKQYATEFFDLPTAIYESQCIIENTLHKLESSQIPYKFDQGGFEHKIEKTYFKEYNHRRSKFNLWDYAEKRTYRPYYHITDSTVHKQISEYYLNAIKT